MNDGKVTKTHVVSEEIDGTVAARSNLRQVMLAFLFVISGTVVAINSWTLWSSWQRTLHNTEESARNLSVSLSRQAQDTFLQADLTLQEIRDRLSTIDFNHPPASLSRLLQARKAVLPQLDGLVVYNARGDWVVSSTTNVPAITNNADREYFRFHQLHPDSGVRISDVVRSRVSGQLIIPVTTRLNNPDGSFRGVMMAAIRLDYFRQFYDYYNLGARDLMALMRTDGHLLYMRPYDSRLINQNISDSPLFTHLLKNTTSGAAVYRAAVDGRARIFGYASLRSYPLVVTAGYDKQQIRQGWIADSISSVLLNLVLLALLLLLGIIVLRHIRLNLKNQLELTRVHEQLTSMNRTLQSLALVDGLTGLANRRQFDWFVPRALERAAKLRSPLAIMLIDVDAFKAYNDTYGHLAGDECLKAVAACLKRLPQHSEDLIARYGGEEFVIILAHKSSAEAQHFAQQAVAAVAGLGLPHRGSSVAEKIVTVSIGLHWQQQITPGEPPAPLLAQADAALYQAKHLGKNRVVVSAPHNGPGRRNQRA